MRDVLGIVLRDRSDCLRAFKRASFESSGAGFVAFPMIFISEAVSIAEEAFIDDGGCGLSAKAAHGQRENRQPATSIARSGLRISCPHIAPHIDNLYVEYQVLARTRVVAVQHCAALCQGYYFQLKFPLAASGR